MIRETLFIVNLFNIFSLLFICPFSGPILRNPDICEARTGRLQVLLDIRFKNSVAFLIRFYYNGAEQIQMESGR